VGGQGRSPRLRSGAAALFLERLPERGFRIDGNDRHVIAVPSGGGRVVRGAADEADLHLVRESSEAGAGYSLREGGASDRGDLARSSRLAGLVSILLEDGRLFRIVPRISGPGVRIELRGWEDAGAYWTCRRARGGFRMEPTVAGRCLEAVDGLLILFAAEILDAVEE
jgi:hypothetical protein